MFRPLENISLPQHFLLLLFAFIIRLPSFHGNFFGEEESLYLLCADRLAAGGSMYLDAWYAGPPLVIWCYEFFTYLFGANALFALRIFSCLYIYLAAAYFNGILITYKPITRYPLMPAVLFIFLASTPWYTQELSNSLLAQLPVIFSFQAIIQLKDSRGPDYSHPLRAGFWMMLAILIAYKLVFLLLGVITAYIFLKRPRLDELMALMGGLFLFTIGFLAYLYVSGTLGGYWKIGLLYYVDRLSLVHSDIYPYDLMFTLEVWAKCWGIIVILGILGFLHFRLRYFTYLVKIRSLETVMLIWAFASLLMLIFKVRRLEMLDFILTIPPLSFYASKPFDFNGMYRIRALILVLILLAPSYLLLQFGGLGYPESMGWIKINPEDKWLHGGTYELFDKQNALSEYFGKNPEIKSIWLLDHNPSLYRRYDLASANKYTDFRIAFYRIEALADKSSRNLRSGTESDRYVYYQCKNNTPDAILDSNDYFRSLRERYPGIFASYKEEQVGNYKIYIPVYSGNVPRLTNN